MANCEGSNERPSEPNAPALVENWVDRFGGPLYRFALGLTHEPQASEEIVQDVLIRAWQAHQRRPSQVLSAAWFYQVARNRCRIE